MGVRTTWAIAIAVTVGCSTGAQVAAPACGSGSEQCGSVCTNLQFDPQNCGACGTACQPGLVCSAGTCALTCSGGATKCGSACTNTQVDPQNCGGCGTVCPSGQVCTAGTCALSCTGGTTKCGGGCTNLQLDPQNCGACGTVCPAGQVCSAGACGLSCVGGSTNCSGTCTNTQVDPTNCGACGNTCVGYETCQQGKCSVTYYTSCKEILAAKKSYGSGYYDIDLTGGDPSDKLTVWCDMKTDGGGWTRVYMGSGNQASTSLGYQAGTLPVVSAASEMVFAFADEGSMTLAQPWKFAVPQPFKTASPMEGVQCGYVALTPTRLSDNSSTNTILRYGWGSFGSTCDQGCSGTWGQICLKSSVNQGVAGGYSDFPMYTSFAHSAVDDCTRSDEAYTTTPCSTSRQFTILVR